MARPANWLKNNRAKTPCLEINKIFPNERIFLPQQFENTWNAQAHEKTTAREIWMQLQSIDCSPDAFVAGVGTGGTIMGVGKYLKKRNPSTKIHPLEPAESPTLSTGDKVGYHRIQGISDEFIPAIVKLHEVDDVIQQGNYFELWASKIRHIFHACLKNRAA